MQLEDHEISCNVKRICSALQEANIFVSDGIGKNLWIEYSNDRAANWLSLPKTNEQIRECLKPYLKSTRMTVDELIKTANEKYPLKITIGKALGQKQYAIIFDSEATNERLTYALDACYVGHELSFTREQVMDLIKLFRLSLIASD